MKKYLKYILLIAGCLISTSLCITFGCLIDKCNTYEMQLQIEKFGYYNSNVIIDMANNNKHQIYNSIMAILFIVALACWIMLCAIYFIEKKEIKK